MASQPWAWMEGHLAREPQGVLLCPDQQSEGCTVGATSDPQCPVGHLCPEVGCSGLRTVSFASGASPSLSEHI